MKDFDLDNVINETRCAIKALSDIDIDDKFSDVSIGQIFYLIEEKSKSMTDTGELIKNKERITSYNAIDSKKIKILRKVNNCLCGLKIYRNIIRPKVKNRMGSFYNRKIIDARELLKFDGEEFIEILYRSILLREVDETGKANSIKFLNSPDTDKVDLIYNIVNSEEGKSNNIKAKGIRGRKILLDIKRRIYSLPLIGYCVRLGVNICLLPRKIKHIYSSMSDIYDAVRFMNDRIDKVKNEIYNTADENKKTENEIRNIEKEIKQNIITNSNLILDINERYSKLKNRTEELEKYRLDRINKIKEYSKRSKREKILMDKFYLRYNEHLMPDSREEVKNRAKVYIGKLDDYFNDYDKKNLSIIDLGCGKGEWLELLDENGYKAIGIDNNTNMVKKLSSILPGAKIVESDAFCYLKVLEDNSVDLISSFHMVEHLEMVEVIELLSECRRVLKNGGIIIIETPNPQNILTSTYYFNMDPTHKKPIPPELLTFIISESGLNVKETLMLYPLNFVPYSYEKEDPIKDIVYRFNMEQAYSVLAVKE